MKALIALLLVLIIVLGFVSQPDSTLPVVQTLPSEKAAEQAVAPLEAMESAPFATRPSAEEAASSALLPSASFGTQDVQRSNPPAVANPPRAMPSDVSPATQPAVVAPVAVAPQIAETRSSVSFAQIPSSAQLPLASFPALGNSQEIVVPQGGRLPAVLIDLAQNTSEQAQAADGITEEFLDGVSDKAPGTPQPQNRLTKDAGAARERAWEAARAEADERYRQLFGDEAYKAYSNAAAIEALREKQLPANLK